MQQADPIRCGRDGDGPTADAFLAALRRLVREPEALDRDYAREVERLTPGTGIDPAFVFAQWWHETDAGQVNRWFRDHNPAGIGIPAASSTQPTPIADGIEAARCHLVALSIVLDRRLPDPQIVPLPPATRRFFDGMLRIAQAPARPDVVTIADLNRPFRDQNNVPQFTWAEDAEYGLKLCNRGNGIFPNVGLPTSAGTSPVAPRWTAMIATHGATLREAPSKDGVILNRFKQYDMVTLLGGGTRGYLACVAGETRGWVHTRHLVANTRGGVTLRTSPAFKDDGSNVARQIPQGALVDLDGHCRVGFVEVAHNGGTAWAFSQYLRIDGKTLREATPGAVAVAGGLGGDDLNLRDAPMLTGSAVVGSVRAGDSVTLTGQAKPGFVSLRWDDERRWALAEDLTGAPVPQPILSGGNLEVDMQTAGMCISQGPFQSPTHAECDCYDFAVPIGTPIHSLAAGRVVFSQAVDDVYRPHKVIVRTEFGDIIYAHLSERHVGEGDQVDGSTLLGLSGTENGPHLHLGLEFGKNGPFSVGLTLTEILDRVGFEVDGFLRC